MGRKAAATRAGEAGAGIAMETLYRVPFLVLECPNIKLKKPSWVHMPSAMTVYALVVVSYFLITGGNARDSNGLKPPGKEERFPPAKEFRSRWTLGGGRKGRRARRPRCAAGA